MFCNLSNLIKWKDDRSFTHRGVSFLLLFLVLLSKGLIKVLQPIHSVAWVTWEATVYKPLKKSMQGPWESAGGQNGPVPEHLRAASWEHQQCDWYLNGFPGSQSMTDLWRGSF